MILNFIFTDRILGKTERVRRNFLTCDCNKMQIRGTKRGMASQR